MTFDNLGCLLGHHPDDNEHDLDKDTELSNTISFLVITGQSYGIEGRYDNEDAALVQNDRGIGPREAIYHIFQPTIAAESKKDSATFQKMITVTHPNQFMFVHFLLNDITKEGSKP